MSSPTKRSTRSSATPRRAAGNSETPRQGNSQLYAPSSPLHYQSSSPGPSNPNNLPGDVSSPFGHMTNSQSDVPSPPLRQMTDTQSDLDPERTPRANPTTPAYHGGENWLNQPYLHLTDHHRIFTYPL